ncbi:hypothetical protein FAI40_04735 [Acetobacteraceae bacterium]|nr:hypothetical protein FAI40_04735 [Acetobacteraceae bacterium]
MRNKLKLGLGILLLGAGCFSASVQAEQVQPEAQTQTETSSELPSFLSKDYKVTDTLWGDWGIKMNTERFEGDPEYPEVTFLSGKSKIDFWPDMNREKWEIAHHMPFKFKVNGRVEVKQINGFSCRGENLKLWFDNGEFVPVGEGVRPNDCGDIAYEHDVFASVPNGGAAEYKDCVEPVALYKLADLTSKHRPVAVTQGKNVLLIKSEDESAIKTYQEKLNPKLHPGFFAQLKRSSDSQKK